MPFGLHSRLHWVPCVLLLFVAFSPRSYAQAGDAEACLPSGGYLKPGIARQLLQQAEESLLCAMPHAQAFRITLTQGKDATVIFTFYEMKSGTCYLQVKELSGAAADYTTGAEDGLWALNPKTQSREPVALSYQNAYSLQPAVFWTFTQQTDFWTLGPMAPADCPRADFYHIEGWDGTQYRSLTEACPNWYSSFHKFVKDYLVTAITDPIQAQRVRSLLGM